MMDRPTGGAAMDAAGGGLWLTPDALAARRDAARGPLAPLAASLAADLAPFLDADLPLPPEKARLSRAGGRCPRDGTYLRFDPRSPRRHECPRCGAAYDDESHYRWWIMGFHLWLAERAVHAAALHALLGDESHHRFAADVLARYADAYLRYPNSDNVLGPSRPFFSTYLESLWLLHLCVALDLLETTTGPTALGATVRERLVAPSVELIAGYDEGASNRQLWNDAAMLAARLALGEREATAPLVWGPSGIAAQLSTSLLADGTWYEGENYHQFAHRGLWYGVRLAAAAGHEPLPAEQLRRFDAGFAAPFLTALPDFTAPARRDSQYAVSLRQWRFAEMAELGLARVPESGTLRAALARIYDGAAPAGDSGRWRSTGEAERNEAPVALDRASLGWRSLLFALPELPPLVGAAPRSLLLDAQGLAVLRRDGGRVYVALDYGHGGGGHGHPDRLDLLYADGVTRWLDDPGTGSYVDPSLHWYRSTLAHCAPLVDGRSQQPASGRLRGWDERGGVGWVDAEVEGTAPGVSLRRAVVVLPDYFVDALTWRADREVLVELPLHAELSLDDVPEWAEHAASADGAAYLRAVERPVGHRPAADGEDGWTLSDTATGRPVAWVTANGPVAWWRAIAPGAPSRPDARLHVAGRTTDGGRICTVWSGRSLVRSVAWHDGALHVWLNDGAHHVHRPSDGAWHIDLLVGGARSAIDLGGERPAAPPAAATERPGPEPPPAVRSLAAPFRAELAEGDYRRSELSWADAGEPRAEVVIAATGDDLVVDVTVVRGEVHFAPPDASNEMDNERAEINADGVQLHLALPGHARPAEPTPAAGWLLAPLAGGDLRVIPLDARAAGISLAAHWRRTSDGYAVRVAVAASALTAAADGATVVGVGVVVNESAPGRERRRGQLVLGGARGEYVYLRGDRHDAARCLPFQLPDA